MVVFAGLLEGLLLCMERRRDRSAGKREAEDKGGYIKDRNILIALAYTIDQTLGLADNARHKLPDVAGGSRHELPDISGNSHEAPGVAQQ